MPISYSFDQERQLVLTKVSGVLTIDVTIDYFERLQQDNDCPERAIEIVDFSDVTNFVLQFGEMSQATERYLNTKSAREILATVFYCTSDLSYGIARMIQALHAITNEKHNVIITRSQEELTECIENLRSNQPDAVDGK